MNCCVPSCLPDIGCAVRRSDSLAAFLSGSGRQVASPSARMLVETAGTKTKRNDAMGKAHALSTHIEISKVFDDQLQTFDISYGC